MPPRVTQVKPGTSSATRPTPSSNGTVLSDVLSRITPIPETNAKRMTCSFYGVPGTGKTRLACTFPKPLLLIATETGTDSVVGTHGVDVAPMTSTSDLSELLDHATTGRSCWDWNGKAWAHLGVGNFTGRKYATVVLDTATKMRTMRIREQFAAMGREVPRAQPFLYADKIWKEVWNQTADDMKKFLGGVLAIPSMFEMCSVINSHEANLTHDDGGSGSDILKPNVASAIGRSVSEFLNAEASYVGQLLIRETYEVQKSGEGIAEMEVKVKTGTEYVMRIGPDAVYRTKFRRPITVTSPLPDFLVNPTYERMLSVIRGEPV